MRKVYGESQKNECVFCPAVATTKNSQGFSTCKECQSKQMPDQKCSCGEYLDIKESKWGAFFLCIHCGPQSVKKVLNNQGETGFKLNKKYRKEPASVFDQKGYTTNSKGERVEFDKAKVYSIDELDELL